MTDAVTRVRVRAPAPALRRARAEVALLSDASLDASARRRIMWIWGLLYLNVLPYYQKSPVFHLPTSVGKLVPQAALAVAFVLALSINKQVSVRPNVFLFLLSVLCATSLMMSLHLYFGTGSVLRAGRLVLFVAILWLLTPWWGNDDLLFVRAHRRALTIVLGVVVAGMLLFPGRAFAQAGGGRLGGVIWPIPPTQVAHYAAVLVGLTIVLWFAGLARARTTVLVGVAGVVLLLLTHTRTALVALLVGVLVAAFSLFLSRQRVRKAMAVTVVIAALVVLCFAPFLSTWFTRGESSQQLSGLTGRQKVWQAVASQPRPELNVVFGYGMSNDSFDGLSIDSSWYSAYLDQGLFGVAVDAAILVLLILIAIYRPRGPGKALALFLVVYCTLASITETGLGQATPYLLDLSIAMSVLMPPLARRTTARRRLPVGPGPRPARPETRAGGR